MILCKIEDRLRPDDNPTSHEATRGKRKNLAQKIDSAVFPGMQGGPLEHIIAAKAVAFGEAMKPEFKTYAQQIVKNARALGDQLTAEGLRLVTGGTDNHLLLVDLRNQNVTGMQAETALDQAHITVNKNTIPYDPRKPFDPSGIRLGTPTLTSRGMKESEMTHVGQLMARAIRGWDKPGELAAVKQSVLDLCKKFPIYGDL